MKKLTYNNPVVEITTWDNADVITTSGVTVISDVTPEIGDSNVTASISYNAIRLSE